MSYNGQKIVLRKASGQTKPCNRRSTIKQLFHTKYGLRPADKSRNDGLIVLPVHRKFLKETRRLEWPDFTMAPVVFVVVTATLWNDA
jgi:hypothetical protein